jgi:hypothetical protein
MRAARSGHGERYNPYHRPFQKIGENPSLFAQNLDSSPKMPQALTKRGNLGNDGSFGEVAVNP